MESINRVSIMSIVIAVIVIGADMMNIIPSVVSTAISGQIAQVVLGVGVVVASAYHLPTAIVLSSLLYVSLNQTEIKVEDDLDVSKNNSVKKESKYEDSMLSELENVNETGIPGVASIDIADDNVLPTQDNSAPNETETDTKIKDVIDGVEPTMINAEDLSLVSGFSGVDMAEVL